MSVFTPVTDDQLHCWLADYTVGELVACRGIEAGIDNSNFFVTTEAGEFILTLFERLIDTEVSYYLQLMNFLGKSLPCARPVADRMGRLCRPLNGKLAALIVRLPGRSVGAPSLADCEQVGAMLARLHLAGQGYPDGRSHPRNLDWCTKTAERVRDYLTDVESDLLDDELQFQWASQNPNLPSGIIHADLFRDNALFADGTLAGLIDFYFAGWGCWLFDLAVTVNDWCLKDDGQFDFDRLDALIRCYDRVRPLSPEEKNYWPTQCRLAAFRFWLSRVYDKHLPRDGHMVLCHDPTHFRQMLSRHIDGAPRWPSGLTVS